MKCLLFTSLDTHDLERALAANPLKSSKGKSRRQPGGKSGRQTKEKKGTTDSSLAAIGGRDTSMFLFRALGKILYCKSKIYYNCFFRFFVSDRPVELELVSKPLGLKRA